MTSIQMDPNTELATAIAQNDVQGFSKAIARGAKLPRPTQKHPIFEWLQAMLSKKEDALPMLELMVKEGLDPEFRVAAVSDRLGRGPFSKTLPKGVASGMGDRGDSLIGRLIYCNQFNAVKWLAQRVPPLSLVHTHPYSPGAQQCPLRRVMLAQQWDVVSIMLDQLEASDIFSSDGEAWHAIHDRALDLQLSQHEVEPIAQEQLDRIFRISRAIGGRFRITPIDGVWEGVAPENLIHWERNIPNLFDRIFEPRERPRTQLWKMLLESPSAYKDQSSILFRILQDERIHQISSMPHPLINSKRNITGTLADFAMLGEVQHENPENRGKTLDILAAAGIPSTLAAGSAFGYVMAKGFMPSSHMSREDWFNRPGELPENALAFCRDGQQFKELVSWGCNPLAASSKGTPAIIDLMRSMRKRASCSRLRSLAIELGDFLSEPPPPFSQDEVMSASCPETGETVLDLSHIHTSLRCRIKPEDRNDSIWPLVSICLAGQRPDGDMQQVLDENSRGPVCLPGTGISPWLFCLIDELRQPGRRSTSQYHAFIENLASLKILGRWPDNNAMEGLQRIVDVYRQRDPDDDKPNLRIVDMFEPGEISSRIKDDADIVFLINSIDVLDEAMVWLLEKEVGHIPDRFLVDFFCKWSDKAIKRKETVDSTHGVDALFPMQSISGLLDRIISMDDNNPRLEEVAVSARKMVEIEKKEDYPNPDLIDQIDARIGRISLMASTKSAVSGARPAPRL